MLTEATVFVMELRVFRLYNNLLNFLFFFFKLQFTVYTGRQDVCFTAS